MSNHYTAGSKDAIQKIHAALKTIRDRNTVIDTGRGMGSADFWMKINGVEYFISVRRSEAQIAKDSQ